MNQADFVTIAKYDTYAIAHVAKSNLEAEGVECHLKDKFNLKRGWKRSNIENGIELLVHRSNEKLASGILRQYNEKALEGADYGDDSEPIVCPFCDSTNVVEQTRPFKSIFITILLLGGPSPFTYRENECQKCGKTWRP